jgi:hypothetical protein
MPAKPTTRISMLNTLRDELNEARAYFAAASALLATAERQDVCDEAKDALRFELKDAAAEYAVAFQCWRAAAQNNVDGF